MRYIVSRFQDLCLSNITGTKKVCLKGKVSLGPVCRRNSETQTTVLGGFIGISGESFFCPHCHTLYYYGLWLGMGSCILPSLKPTQNCRVRVWNKTPTFWCRVFLLMAKCGFREGELRCLKGKNNSSKATFW